MKKRFATFARSPFWARGFRSRAVALFASVAISTCTAVRLDAVVIDDFAGPVKFLTGFFGTNFVAPSLTNGQLVLSGQFPGPLVPGNPYPNLDNIAWSNCFPAVSLEGRTLELRMDLVHASADDVFLMLAVETTWIGSGYAVLIDQNEVALFKYGGTLAVLFWTDAAVTNQNVTVSLALTRMTNTMLVTTRVLDKGKGRSLFERSFVDTPGSDVGAPAPPPKGMTIFAADPGGPYTSFTTALAGVWDLRTTSPPPLEVVLDNLEYDLYDVPSLRIANSVLLSWSENTAEEQIVIGADSLASNAVWSPWSEPIYKRFGELCMTVPVTASNWVGKLVPGRQFADDFSDTWGPFTNRNSWLPFWNEAGEEWIVTNGVLELNWNAPPTSPGFVLAPLGTNVAADLRDFYTSVDILDWETGGTNWSVLALVGRSHLTSPTSGVAYWGGLTLNANGVPGNVEPWILVSPVDYDRGATFSIHQFPPPYRLQFSVVGTHISFRVLSLTTGQSREMSLNDSNFTQGFPAVWINGRNDAGDTFTITTDNFFVTGTKP